MNTRSSGRERVDDTVDRACGRQRKRERSTKQEVEWVVGEGQTSISVKSISKRNHSRNNYHALIISARR